MHFVNLIVEVKVHSFNGKFYPVENLILVYSLLNCKFDTNRYQTCSCSSVFDKQ